MIRLTDIRRTSGALALWLLLATSTSAQDGAVKEVIKEGGKDSQVQTEAKATPEAEPPASLEKKPDPTPQKQPDTKPEAKPAKIQIKSDAGFDRYINRKLMGRAIKSLDPVLLTDLALQFVEGERVLLRSHKSITAEEVLKLALQVAVDKRDEKSIERLGKAIERHGSKELAAQFKVSQQLATASRAIDPALVVSVESMNPQTFAMYQKTLQYIENKRLRGEVEHLKAFRERLPGLKDLGEAERHAAEQRLDAALASAPENGNSAISTLAMLSKSSRADVKPAVMGIDERLYGTWIDGGQLHAFTKQSTNSANYAMKPVGQKTVTRVLEATDKDRIYRMKTSNSAGVFLVFNFSSSGKEVSVQRFDGKAYVPYGTWTRRPRKSTTTTALNSQSRAIHAKSGGSEGSQSGGHASDVLQAPSHSTSSATGGSKSTKSGSQASDQLALLSASSRSDSKYAAIAYSRSTRAHGYSYSASSRAKAEEVALDNCSGSDSRIVVWVKNGYAALALNSRGGSGWGQSTDKATAEAIALRNCPGGYIKRTVFSGR